MGEGGSILPPPREAFKSEEGSCHALSLCTCLSYGADSTGASPGRQSPAKHVLPLRSHRVSHLWWARSS